MADNKDFLINNLNKLISGKPASKTELDTKSNKLKEELAKEAKKVNKAQIKEKKEPKKQVKTKETNDQKPDNNTDDNSNSDQGSEPSNPKPNNTEPVMPELNSLSNREKLIDYISKNLELGFSKYEILEHLVEFGVDYHYANNLVESFQTNETTHKNELKENVFGMGEHKLNKSEKKTNILNFIILIFIILFISTVSNTSPIIVGLAFIPSVINLLVMTFYFSKLRIKNYYTSNIFYLIIIVAFSLLFSNYEAFSNQLDIKAITALNLILTFVFALFEFENLFLFSKNLLSKTNIDKKQENKKEIEKTIESNIRVLKKQIKQLNDLIRDTYKAKNKDLSNLLIDNKQIKLLENVDYKNIILKSHNYLNAVDLLEYQIKRLEDNEKVLVPELIKSTPKLKRDPNGRYSILSVIMVNNEEIDLKKLYDNIFFIIDTIKGEFYNISI